MHEESKLAIANFKLKLESLKGVQQELSHALEQADVTNQGLRKKILTQETKLSELNREKDTLGTRNIALERQVKDLEKLQAELAAMKKSSAPASISKEVGIGRLTTENFKLRQERDELKSERDELKVEVAALLAAVKEFDAGITGVKGDMEAAIQRRTEERVVAPGKKSTVVSPLSVFKKTGQPLPLPKLKSGQPDAISLGAT
jgi:predicted RNase H-like nuclease (RuvC/YqgF family)